jgi:1-acyl-sn-glycerol-3-phosphate acyltransferase
VKQETAVTSSGDDSREYGRLYPVAKAVLTPCFRFLWRIHVEGSDHVPAEGPAIFCPNHTSVIDSFFLPVVLPRRITFVGKSEYLDSWKTRHLFPALGMIPIDRSGGSASERALNTAARVLERGEFFGIYPEGTRARDGKLHRGRTGAARLALRTGAPLIPVGIVGTREIQPPDARFPKPFRAIRVAFGQPVRPERYADRSDDRLVLRQMTDEVMFEIRNLTGQDYVDEYAGKKDERMETAPTARIPSSVGGNGHEPDSETEAEPPRRSSAEALARWQ